MAKLKINIRNMQIALGLLWLLDGILQLQPRMFTSAFANNVIAPAAQGEPGFVYALMHFALHLVLLQPAWFNALFALIQLSLGTLIIYKKTTKFGLIASAVWAFIVWSFGEGFGGIFSGHTLLLIGAPGAAVLYLLLALSLLPKKDRLNASPRYWLVFVWLCIWLGGGIYQLLPGQDNARNIGSIISSNAAGAPGWLASLDSHVGKWIIGLGHYSFDSHPVMVQMAGMSMSAPVSSGSSHPGYLLILGLALVQLLIGLGVLFPGIWRRIMIIAGSILALAFWVLGQNMGGFYSGTMTDPNSGPLFVLLGLTLLGISGLDAQLSQFGKRVSALLLGDNHNLKQFVVEPVESEIIQ
jgi:hypothetical protein